ncbi:Retrovirus-related Pol polyprotein from transposon 412 [Araneus ventricosus]|uniref:Retrovirus-related Pol polyprotein from transposon 412 n=1 Tax=Araneus ventricosus TaxID=182803 RepID=A0A4Y2DWS6_ARAVE|nr:Retrovirus-related Pol polyprotein from transposon 412 [Araneus ventricosus]
MRYGQEERKFLCFQPVYSIQSRATYWPKKRTIIPARSECLIQGVPEVPGQFRYAVTDFHSQVPQKGILVAATLVDLEREAIPVRVLNLNNTPKILDKGAVIATCEPVGGIFAPTQDKTLYKLTEAKSNFNWTDECEKSFNSLKQALTSAPILTYPRIDKDVILDTDASNEGIGAVLSQNIKNEERVIAYFSKSLGKPERNCVTRKELLAIVKFIEHFHHYLYGRKFLLRTNHASLRWLLHFKEPEGQIARWIQDFRSTILKSSIEKGPLTEMQMPSPKDHVKKAANSARIPRKSSEWRQTFP